MTRLLTLLCAFVVAAPLLVSQQFDQTFGLSGKRRIGFGEGTNETASWVRVASNGSIYVVGTIANPDNSNPTGVAKLTSDGTPDDSYHGDGKNSVLFGFGVFAHGATLQSDGKLVVVGMHRSSNAGSAATPGVLRFTEDGSIDTTFGTGGQFKQKFDAGSSGAFADVHQLDGGRLLCVGTSSGNINGGRNAVGMMMLNANGTLDATWGEGGMVREGNESNTILGSAVAADSSIWVASVAEASGGRKYRFTKYTKRGVSASQFEDVFPFENPISRNGWVRLADGSFLMAGTLQVPNGGGRRMAVVKFTAAGALDVTFGTNGIGIVAANVDCECRGLTVLADGGIFLTGLASTSFGDGCIGKLRADGKPEVTWGTNGFMNASLNGNSGTHAIRMVAVTADAKLIVLGSDSDLIVARIGDGPVSVQNESDAHLTCTIMSNGAMPTLRVNMTQPSSLMLDVYDLQGHRHFSSAITERPAGSHIVPIDGAALPSGQYLLSVVSAYGRTTVPLVIVR